MKRQLLTSFVVLLVLATSTSSHAGWELYDDFSSGSIDTQKWRIDDSSASISVEGGRAKFVHQPGHANDSSWLEMIQNPENITGMKATVTVQSCTGDVRARMNGYVGRIGENHIYSTITFESEDKRIYTSVGLEGPPPDYTWVQEMAYNHFYYPTDIIGHSFIIAMMFYVDRIEYEVDGLGKIVYRYEEEINSATHFWRGIGTRSTKGQGPCTVYFDDVFVFVP
jgi:hypothetical protein